MKATPNTKIKVSSKPEVENINCYRKTYYYYEQENGVSYSGGFKASIYKVTELRRSDNDQCLDKTEDRIHHAKLEYIRKQNWLEKYGLHISTTGKRITHDRDLIQFYAPNYDPEKDRTCVSVYVDNQDGLSEMLERGYVGISNYGDCEEDRRKRVQRKMTIRKVENIEVGNCLDYQCQTDEMAKRAKAKTNHI